MTWLSRETVKARVRPFSSNEVIKIMSGVDDYCTSHETEASSKFNYAIGIITRKPDSVSPH